MPVFVTVTRALVASNLAKQMLIRQHMTSIVLQMS
jgi:hypothetical protein